MNPASPVFNNGPLPAVKSDAAHDSSDMPARTTRSPALSASPVEFHPMAHHNRSMNGAPVFIPQQSTTFIPAMSRPPAQANFMMPHPFAVGAGPPNSHAHPPPHFMPQFLMAAQHGPAGPQFIPVPAGSYPMAYLPPPHFPAPTPSSGGNAPAPYGQPNFAPYMPVPVPVTNPTFSSFNMTNIYPFNISFGELSHAELNMAVRSLHNKQPYISVYNALNERKKGKRSVLLTIGGDEENLPNTVGFVPRTFTILNNPRMRTIRIPAPPESAEITTGSDIEISTGKSQRPSRSNSVSSGRGSSSKANGNSWAGLFRGTERLAIDTDDKQQGSNQSSLDQEELVSPQSADSGPSATEHGFVTALNSPLSWQSSVSKPKNALDAFVQSYNVSAEDGSDVLLVYRGLVNRGNMCFMNAILQPLLHCGPFYEFLNKLSQSVPLDFHNNRPLIDALIMFIKEFLLDDGSLTDDERRGTPFTESFIPEYVYDALNADERFKSTKGRQQDAEEFLGFLLDGVHEELIKDTTSMTTNDSASDEWIEIGAKSRPAITRSIEFKESPITKLFGGTMRSTLRSPGQKDSINIEPFHSLQLDLSHDDVASVQDAIVHISHAETIDDYGPQHQQATKQILIDHLPPVIILHLKRFIFVDGRTQKLAKPIDYSLDLEIPPEVMASAKRVGSVPAIRYKLFGVVYHHGKSATDGHYTCDIRRSNGEWLRIDDTVINKISAEQLLEKSTSRTAYLLFYIRDNSAPALQESVNGFAAN